MVEEQLMDGGGNEGGRRRRRRKDSSNGNGGQSLSGGARNCCVSMRVWTYSEHPGREEGGVVHNIAITVLAFWQMDK